MTIEDKANAALDMVYSARTPAEMAAAYAAWAASYDGETAALGYCLPFLIPAWVARYVPAGEGPLLDAGCGTGLSGPCLKALGYHDVAGLDLSADMLRIAGSRDAYNDLREAALGGPLPWPDNHFRAFFSTGVFTISHAPAATPSSRFATKCLIPEVFPRSSPRWSSGESGGRSKKANGSEPMSSPTRTRW